MIAIKRNGASSHDGSGSESTSYAGGSCVGSDAPPYGSAGAASLGAGLSAGPYAPEVGCRGAGSEASSIGSAASGSLAGEPSSPV
jgi:hypothetical protein